MDSPFQINLPLLQHTILVLILHPTLRNLRSRLLKTPLIALGVDFCRNLVEGLSVSVLNLLRSLVVVVGFGGGRHGIVVIVVGGG